MGYLDGMARNHRDFYSFVETNITELTEDIKNTLERYVVLLYSRTSDDQIS